MITNIKYWRKKAKKIARAEGVSSLRFYPTKGSISYNGVALNGWYIPSKRTIAFRTRTLGVNKPLPTLLHELAHCLDSRTAKGLPYYKQHDETFQKILSRLNRKYLWK